MELVAGAFLPNPVELAPVLPVPREAAGPASVHPVGPEAVLSLTPSESLMVTNIVALLRRGDTIPAPAHQAPGCPDGKVLLPPASCCPP